jgi:hypothetical protein
VRDCKRFEENEWSDEKDIGPHNLEYKIFVKMPYNKMPELNVVITIRKHNITAHKVLQW